MKNIKIYSTQLQRFARNKNAIRGHFIAEYVPGEAMPEVTNATAWKELAKWISTIDDDSNEEVDDTGFYDGDGTPENNVTSVAIAYSFEGNYDSQDPAQALIASKKRLIVEGRKLWHMVVSSDLSTMWLGRATVTDIVAGGGDAVEFETFSCTITYDTIPEETVAEGVGVPPNINGSNSVYPTAVEFTSGVAPIAVGQSLDLKPHLSFTPSNANVRTGVWATNNKQRAVVNPNGVVTGVTAGAVTIVFVSSSGLIAEVDLTIA